MNIGSEFDRANKEKKEEKKMPKFIVEKKDRRRRIHCRV